MLKTKNKLLKLERLPNNEWAFNRPQEWEFFGAKLEKAEVADRAGDIEEAFRICKEIIETCPEYLPARNMLGIFLRDEGDTKGALLHFESATEMGLNSFPEEFNFETDQVPWHWPDN